MKCTSSFCIIHGFSIQENLVLLAIIPVKTTCLSPAKYGDRVADVAVVNSEIHDEKSHATSARFLAFWEKRDSLVVVFFSLAEWMAQNKSKLYIYH